MELIEIGSRIKAQRRKMGISQEKLAEIVYVTPHYIYEIERGLKAMSLETLINLCAALDLSADYILFGEKQASPSLSEQLSSLSEERRLKAESAFKAILPYIN
ncbi:MAG: helix-turn-helix domain-containing protein [Ruminiclostridium sp.]